jgi:tetratricopeptide (TPR) repeat protein
MSRFYERGEFEKAYKVLLALKEEYPNSGVFYAVWADLEMRVNNNLTRAEHLVNEAHHLGCPEDRYHRTYGDLLWRRGEIKEALIEYERCVATEPSVDNLSAFARALSAASDERAVSAWENVIRQDRKNYMAYAYLAREAGKRNELAKAFELMRKAEQVKRSDGKGLFEVGTVYHVLEDYKKGLEYLLRAKEKGFYEKGGREPLDSQVACCYLRLGDGEKAIQHALEAVELEPKNEYAQETLNYCKQHVLRLCGDGRYEAAYPMMSVALKIWPEDSQVLAYMAGLEIVFKKNYEAGQNYMDKAFEHKNTDLDFLYAFKGQLWFDDIGKKEEGLACLEKAVSLNRSAWNLTALGSRIVDSDGERAQKLFKEALQLEPENPGLISTIATGQMKQGNWSEGLELALKACALKPCDPLINVTAAHGHFGLEQFEKALQFYAKAEKLGYYDKVYLYNAIGECYKELGNKKEARKYLKKALKIDPDSSEAKNLLSEAS